MDFDEALEAHKAWKATLLAYIGDPDGSLTNSAVTDDTACDLGKWIYSGHTKAYDGDVDFIKLRAFHAAFHVRAAEVVRKVDRGEESVAEVLVGSRSTYARASDELVGCILRMKERFP